MRTQCPAAAPLAARGCDESIYTGTPDPFCRLLRGFGELQCRTFWELHESYIRDQEAIPVAYVV